LHLGPGLLDDLGLLDDIRREQLCRFLGRTPDNLQPLRGEAVADLFQLQGV